VSIGMTRAGCITAQDHDMQPNSSLAVSDSFDQQLWARICANYVLDCVVSTSLLILYAVK